MNELHTELAGILWKSIRTLTPKATLL